jgi:pyruvate formate lyase activating enzyme
MIIKAKFSNGEKCGLCPHNCVISGGGAGFCSARRNTGGELTAESYGQITSLALDPIEKKPLYHFRPGSKILSAGSYGCNMKCAFCQNYGISQSRAVSEYMPPEKLAETSAGIPGNIGVAFTYNEPLVGIEYILDAAPVIRRNGQVVVMVSNGQINPEPLSELLPLVDAWNIDVKSFAPEFYRSHGGDFETVKHTVEAAAKVSHVEVTTLIIPGENDCVSEISALAEWLAGISPDIPLHLSRFFPRYKMPDKPPTPQATILRLAEAAKQRLHFVYPGNM